MKQYLNLIKYIINKGEKRIDRTGIGTISIFGYQMRFNLQSGFPLITTKKCQIRSIIYELLWFLKGETNIDFLQKHNVSIWNHWADKKGNLGPIYGKQWRNWSTKNGKPIDQVANVIKEIKCNPNSRRIIISSWNVSDLDKMALCPCHILCQFYVQNNMLSCQIYQRSCDIFLGLPFNLASYALLMHMISQQCNLQIRDLIWTGGDIHLYNNHLNQAKIQLTRIPHTLPNLVIKRKPHSIFDYIFEDFEIQNYNPYSTIKAPIAI
ncbi:MAG: thymidylate synthase [Pantoea sp. Brub]|nr:thymidylate synthase [Pantoea sp. Brub]